jgi:hypothetical protein
MRIAWLLAEKFRAIYYKQRNILPIGSITCNILYNLGISNRQRWDPSGGMF